MTVWAKHKVSKGHYACTGFNKKTNKSCNYVADIRSDAWLPPCPECGGAEFRKV